MTDTPARLVVIGVDGSAESQAALRWVADEARPTLDAVRVVHAQTGRGWAAELAAEMIVESGVSTLRHLNPRLAVEGVAFAGEPVGLLVEWSARAALVVVGGVSRALWDERRGGRRIGLAVAAKARCPVVVVPDGAALPSRRLPIAVLTMDGDSSDAVLCAAFRSAAARGCGLVATSVWDLGTAGHPADRAQVATWQIEAQQAFDRALLRWQDDFPSVPVVSRLRHRRRTRTHCTAPGSQH